MKNCPILRWQNASYHLKIFSLFTSKVFFGGEGQIWHEAFALICLYLLTALDYKTSQDICPIFYTYLAIDMKTPPLLRNFYFYFNLLSLMGFFKGCHS